MKLNFQYSKEKDIWCLLNKGKASGNSKLPTKRYEELVNQYGKDPTPENASTFIENYMTENNIDIDQFIADYQKDWSVISDEYQTRAEKIFGAVLPRDITVYLTINDRCPYYIENDYFFVSMTSPLSIRKLTVAHELWHFYTWYGLGADELQKLGAQKYNDLKESLTVLLNIECKDLLPEGVQDIGYPQHQETRQRILKYWENEKNIKNLWGILAKEMD